MSDWCSETGTIVQELARGEGPGRLVVVATPLGNLGDISRRALELLENADVIYCEDTRHSNKLFSAHGISVRSRLQSLHEHNEASQCEAVVARVRAGQTVVLISDAGTPGISDPGSRVVAAVAGAGLVVTTAPGPSAVVAALSVSGLATERFVMEGFVARKLGEREQRYAQWASEPRTIVFYESPQRLVRTLGELAEHFPARRAVVAREMTKLHEEIVRGTLEELFRAFSSREVVGEIVVVLEGAVLAPDVDEATLRGALADQLASGASVRDAVSSVSDELGSSRREAYRIALELRAAQR
ncbi:MAG: 16S rRNA (cytidine(1402)-2'-O)-methyltransferase [Acidimicrobiales bacterium]